MCMSYPLRNASHVVTHLPRRWETKSNLLFESDLPTDEVHVTAAPRRSPPHSAAAWENRALLSWRLAASIAGK